MVTKFNPNKRITMFHQTENANVFMSVTDPMPLPEAYLQLGRSLGHNVIPFIGKKVKALIDTPQEEYNWFAFLNRAFIDGEYLEPGRWWNKIPRTRSQHAFEYEVYEFYSMEWDKLDGVDGYFVTLDKAHQSDSYPRLPSPDHITAGHLVTTFVPLEEGRVSTPQEAVYRACRRLEITKVCADDILNYKSDNGLSIHVHDLNGKGIIQGGC